MAIASLTSKGQVTIPKDVRDRLKLRTGDKLDFQVAEDGTITARPMSIRVDNVFGMLHTPEGPAFTVQEMNQRVRARFQKASE